jgi:cytochrome c peroxidase
MPAARTIIVAIACCLAGGCKSKDAPAPRADDTAASQQAAPAAPAAPPGDAAPRSDDIELDLPPPPPVPELPLGLPPLPESTARARDSAAEVALGRMLFFDSRLSRPGLSSTDSAMSCASCHDPERGWADGRVRADTVAGKPNLRHTPALVNLAYATELFWDGRVSDLEAMIEVHWKGQMLAGHSAAGATARLADIPAYPAHFRRAFGDRTISAAAVSAALAAFVRTLFSGDSPWDRYEAGDRSAVSEDAIAGFAIFTRKAQCALCHPPPLYTDGGYHDVGVGAIGPDDMLIDVGRALVTRDAHDEGAFKTPTLRGATRTAPYYHDGSAASLAETLEHGLRAAALRAAPGTVPGRLSSEEIQQLMAFLQALTPDDAALVPPGLPRPPAARQPTEDTPAEPAPAEPAPAAPVQAEPAPAGSTR